MTQDTVRAGGVVVGIATLLALATPAAAQTGGHHVSHHHISHSHSAMSHHSAMAGPTNPCLLGTVVGGQCVGPVQVTEQVMVTGTGPTAPVAAPAPVYAPAAAPVMTAPVQMASTSTGGCIPAGPPAMVSCPGNWVPVQPAPVYAPPAPVYAPPAPVYAPAPVPVAGIAPGALPLSFFVGGMTNGVGFNTGTEYTGGFGGGIIIQGGGTRFSGVRERSPIPLVPPRRMPRHNPHYGGGGGCGGCH